MKGQRDFIVLPAGLCCNHLSSCFNNPLNMNIKPV